MSDGIVRFKGAVSSGTDSLLFTLPPEMRPATDVYVAVDLCSAAAGRLWIQPSGNVSVETLGVGSLSDAQCFTSLDGAWFVAPPPRGFTSVTLLNGWFDQAFGTHTAEVAIFDGIVNFKGGLSGGAADTLFDLHSAGRRGGPSCRSQGPPARRHSHSGVERAEA
ncbi:MAG TPA: hypothetical protein VMS55_08520 [Myxococcota bacterium]|nr:hypothetical protein [Myxococcota bacterium]